MSLVLLEHLFLWTFFLRWLSSPSKPQLSKPQLIQAMNSGGCNNFLKPLTTFTPSKPQLSKPQLIQTMSSGGCNNFLKPLTTSTPHPNHNYPSHNWSKPWVLEDLIISSNPDNFPSFIQTTIIQHMQPSCSGKFHRPEREQPWDRGHREGRPLGLGFPCDLFILCRHQISNLVVNTNPNKVRWERTALPPPLRRSQTGPMEQDWASSLISMTTISGLFSLVPMEEMGPKYARKKDGAWIGLSVVDSVNS